MSFEPTDPTVDSTPGAERAPISEATPVSPVSPPPPPVKRKKSLLFWGLIGVAAGVVVFLAALALASYGQSASSAGLRGYLPANTVAYFEARADLPGDQRANLEAIAAKFPALAGTTLGARSEQLLDQMLTSSKTSFSKDIEPWLSGSFGLAITDEALGSMDQVATDISAAGSGTSGAAGAALAKSASSLKNGVLLLAADKNDKLAGAWLNQQSGGSGQTQTYAGTTITVSGDSSSQLAYAISDHIIFAGSLSTVEAALDTKGNGGLARSASFVAAAKSAPANSLAFAYTDVSALVSAVAKSNVLSLASPAPDCTGASADSLICQYMASGSYSPPPSCNPGSSMSVPASTWLAGSFQAEPNALTLTGNLNLAATDPAVSDHPSAIAAHLPADTLAAVELRDLGPGLIKAIKTLETVLACDSTFAPTTGAIDQFLTSLGGASALVGWMGDGAIAIVPNGTSFGGGLAATVADPTAANRFIDQIQAVLTLSGSITPSSQTYNGATLTMIDIPNSSGSTNKVTVAATVSGGVFVLGTLDFVKATLDAKATASLASNPAYTSIISRAGGDGVSDVFVDLAALRTAAAGLTVGASDTYNSQIKPNLTPLSALGLVIRTSTTDVTAHLILTFTP